jgi:hypothetical protein
MSYETKAKEPRVLKCPFCDKGDIETVYQAARVEKRLKGQRLQQDDSRPHR